MATDFYNILIHHRLKGLLAGQATPFRGEVQKTLERLQLGYWGNGTRVKALRGVRKPVYEARVTRAIRMLFTVVRISDTEPPYALSPHVLVWDIVGHDNINRARRMNIVPETGFLDFAEFATATLAETPDCPEALLPNQEGTPDLLEYVNDPLNVPETEAMVESIRWYELTPEIVADEAEWQALLDDPSVNDLELKLSREQAESVYLPGPVLLRGTAGSGKTTVSVYRLARLVMEQPQSRILYVTYSEPLLETVRSLFHDLFRSRRETPPRVPDFYTFPQLYAEIAGGELPSVRLAAFEEWYRQAYRLSDAALAWEEIRGIVKGACTEPGQVGLSREAYERLGRKRAPLFVAERPRLFKVYERYQGWLRAQNRSDDVDAARAALRQLAPAHVYDHVVCDEGQDLTEVELLLLLRLVRRMDGLLFAADPQQIVNPSGFRWAELRTLIRSQDRHTGAPDIYSLTRNFRSVHSIVSLANALLTIQRERTGRSDDDGLQSTTLHGPTPVIVHGTEEEVAAKINDFGPRCAVVVLESEARDRLAKLLGSERVFDVQSCKGLEFDACVLWNPLGGDREVWERLLVSDEPMREDPVARRAIHHTYVAVTRARRYLGIFESTAEARALWETAPFRGQLESDNAAALSKFMVFAASPEEWESEGDYFLARQRFRQAAECFRRAGKPVRERESLAGHYASVHAFGKAAELYLELSMALEAAECYAEAGKHLQAAELFANSAEWGRAAQAFERHSRMKEAADCYTKAGQAEESTRCRLAYFESRKMWKQAAKLCRKLDRIEQAIGLYRRAGMRREADDLRLSHGTESAKPEELAKVLERRGELLPAAEYYERAGEIVQAARCRAEVATGKGDWEAAEKIWAGAGQDDRAKLCRAQGCRSRQEYYQAACVFHELRRTKESQECLAVATCKRGVAMREGMALRAKGEFLKAAWALEDAELYEIACNCLVRTSQSGDTPEVNEFVIREGMRAGRDELLKLVSNESESRTKLLAAAFCEERERMRDAAKFHCWAKQFEAAERCQLEIGPEKEVARIRALAAEDGQNWELAAEHWLEAKRMNKHHTCAARHLEARGAYLEAAEHYDAMGQNRKAQACREHAQTTSF